MSLIYIVKGSLRSIYEKGKKLVLKYRWHCLDCGARCLEIDGEHNADHWWTEEELYGTEDE